MRQVVEPVVVDVERAGRHLVQSGFQMWTRSRSTRRTAALPRRPRRVAEAGGELEPAGAAAHHHHPVQRGGVDRAPAGAGGLVRLGRQRHGGLLALELRDGVLHGLSPRPVSWLGC